MSRLKFYILIFFELLLFPLLFLFVYLKNNFPSSIFKQTIKYKINKNDLSKKIIFVVHEWAGYDFSRKKQIKYVNKEFDCGLKYHMERINCYNGPFDLEKIITISDFSPEYQKSLESKDFYNSSYKIYPVSNLSMDFSGYNHVAKNLLPEEDCFVFLTNSSVESAKVDFIDNHVKIFLEDPTLGLLGVSYCTKIYQSFIRNNFHPHVQSFFLVTRASVLKELLALNNGNLPGAKEAFKLSLIRFGEVKFTKDIQKLGYKVGIILEDMNFYEIPKSSILDSGFSRWSQPFGDFRLYANNPNRINLSKNH